MDVVPGTFDYDDLEGGLGNSLGGVLDGAPEKAPRNTFKNVFGDTSGDGSVFRIQRTGEIENGEAGPRGIAQRRKGGSFESLAMSARPLEGAGKRLGIVGKASCALCGLTFRGKRALRLEKRQVLPIVHEGSDALLAKTASPGKVAFLQSETRGFIRRAQTRALEHKRRYGQNIRNVSTIRSASAGRNGQGTRNALVNRGFSRGAVAREPRRHAIAKQTLERYAAAHGVADEHRRRALPPGDKLDEKTHGLACGIHLVSSDVVGKRLPNLGRIQAPAAIRAQALPVTREIERVNRVEGPGLQQQRGDLPPRLRALREAVQQDNGGDICH